MGVDIMSSEVIGLICIFGLAILFAIIGIISSEAAIKRVNRRQYLRDMGIIDK